jgi:hypothetical protein
MIICHQQFFIWHEVVLISGTSASAIEESSILRLLLQIELIISFLTSLKIEYVHLSLSSYHVIISFYFSNIPYFDIFRIAGKFTRILFVEHFWTTRLWIVNHEYIVWIICCFCLDYLMSNIYWNKGEQSWANWCPDSRRHRYVVVLVVKIRWLVYEQK